MFIYKYNLIVIFALPILATEKTRKSPWKIYDYINFIVLDVNTYRLISPQIQIGIVHQSQLKQFFAS